MSSGTRVEIKGKSGDSPCQLEDLLQAGLSRDPDFSQRCGVFIRVVTPGLLRKNVKKSNFRL